jgi:hypothetical protein
MDAKSLKRTLFIYLAYTFMISGVLTAICLLIEHTPSTKSSIQRFGTGALALNSFFMELVVYNYRGDFIIQHT